MKTIIEKLALAQQSFSEEEDEILRRAGSVIQNGGLVAFPTETVYGLGGDALNQESARRIYAAKGRPSDNPLIVHICRLEDLNEIVDEVSEEAIRVAEAFWPGPLTMILRRSNRVPRETTGGLDTVAVRFPSHPVARQLIAYSGGFVAAPSANLSGRPSPTQARYVVEDMDGRIDMILDGGTVGIGLESTIIDLTVMPPQILRPGYVTHEMLEKVLTKVDIDVTILQGNSVQAPRAPGMKYRHYAPKGELVIVEGPLMQAAAYMNRMASENSARGERTGIIGTEESIGLYHADVVKSLGAREDQDTIAKNLYSVLRQMDEEKVAKIYSESFTDRDIGQAIMNRLLKAAGHRVVKIPCNNEQ